MLALVLYEKGEWDEVNHLPYRRLLTGGDWYWFDVSTGEYGAVRTHPEWGKWKEDPSSTDRASKKGEAVSNEEMETVDDLAMAATTL